MKLKYLGTAAAEGQPGIFCRCALCLEASRRGGKDIRTRSQALVDNSLLIDFPPDSYWHMVHHGVDLPNIRHVLVTHTHQDHFYPDEFYYRRRGFCRTEGLLTLYGNDALKKRMDSYLEESGSSYAHSKLACVELQPFARHDIDGFGVTPLLAAHDRSERCYIYLIESGGKRLLYGNDTGVFPEATWAHIRGKPFDLISLDCTHGKEAEGSNHMGVPDLFEIRKRLEESGCVKENTRFVATHFSHNGGLLHEQLEEALAPAGFSVAYDGMEIEV